MIAKGMIKYVEGNSAIRAMFEEGAKMAKEFGTENVYDFSLGNPSVPAPKEVNESIKAIVDKEDSNFVHGYTQSNSGYEDVRQTIAEHLNKLHGTNFSSANILMTVGAASALNVALKTLFDPGDEAIAFAPYFVEYRNYVANYGGNLKVVSPNPPTFQPNLEEMESLITPKTKAVIINSPNNPTGIIYSEETIKKMAEILKKKGEEYGTEIFIIADEPYRELVFEDEEVPYVTKYYNNVFVGYSWSKSLSLPGERIGYLVIPSEVDDFETTASAANIANRIMGFVNAPTLMQRVVAKCVDCKTDIAAYDRNRKAFYDGLKEIGYKCTKPAGAFYLWIKTEVNGKQYDDGEFVAAAKKHHILVVPGASFAGPGYVRAAYCVSYDTIMNSLPAFKALYEELS